MGTQISDFVSFFRDWLFEQKRINSTSSKLSDYCIKIVLENDSYFKIETSETDPDSYSVSFCENTVATGNDPAGAHKKTAVKISDLMQHSFANISSDDELTLKTFFQDHFGELLDSIFDQED